MSYQIKAQIEPTIYLHNFYNDSFIANNLKTIILISILRNEKKKYTLALIKSAGLIKELVDKSLHLLFNNKSSIKM